jgi:hypothetical protein
MLSDHSICVSCITVEKEQCSATQSPERRFARGPSTREVMTERGLHLKSLLEKLLCAKGYSLHMLVLYLSVSEGALTQGERLLSSSELWQS